MSTHDTIRSLVTTALLAIHCAALAASRTALISEDLEDVRPYNITITERSATTVRLAISKGGAPFTPTNYTTMLWFGGEEGGATVTNSTRGVGYVTFDLTASSVPTNGVFQSEILAVADGSNDFESWGSGKVRIQLSPSQSANPTGWYDCGWTNVIAALATDTQFAGIIPARTVPLTEDLENVMPYVLSFTEAAATTVRLTLTKGGKAFDPSGYAPVFWYGTDDGGVTVTNYAVSGSSVLFALSSSDIPTNGTYLSQIWAMPIAGGGAEEWGSGKVRITGNASRAANPVNWVPGDFYMAISNACASVALDYFGNLTNLNVTVPAAWVLEVPAASAAISGLTNGTELTWHDGCWTNRDIGCWMDSRVVASTNLTIEPVLRGGDDWRLSPSLSDGYMAYSRIVDARGGAWTQAVAAAHYYLNGSRYIVAHWRPAHTTTALADADTCAAEIESKVESAMDDILPDRLAAMHSQISGEIFSAVRDATNNLATVAHTGDYASLTNAPTLEIRANLDGDGKVRYRIFSISSTQQKGK